MILEYSYDKANKILDYFRSGEIAYLSIKKTTKGNGDETYAMEYSLVSTYPDDKVKLIKIALHKSLPMRLDVTKLLTQFIQNQSIGNIDDFDFVFNAVDVAECTVNYRIEYKSKNAELCDHMELVKCLERLDLITTRMGVTDIKLDNIFKRENGRGKKYISLSISDVIDILRKSLTEDE